MTSSRREFLKAAALGAAGVLVAHRAFALPAAPIAINVYKSLSCGCCAEWVAHLRKNGFTPTIHDTDDLITIKRSAGVPTALESCHTAFVGPYFIEGHVPADLIKKLLADRPRDVAGLSVPGMVDGSPGMEGARKQPYDIIALSKGGKTSVYARR